MNRQCRRFLLQLIFQGWATISSIPGRIVNIIDDYHQSLTEDDKTRIIYPGERVLETRKNNLIKGIPVIKTIWDKIVQL